MPLPRYGLTGAPVYNERQMEAIGHTFGPMEVLAGHGTGKTQLLVARFKALCDRKIAWKFDILVVTFTRPAAGQMRERIQYELAEDVENLRVTTYHAFCHALLESELGKRDDDKPFRVKDPPRAFSVLLQAMRDVGVTDTRLRPRFIAEQIAQAKENGLSPEHYLSVPGSPNMRTVADVFRRYQEILRAENAHDFADLVYESIHLLETRPEVLTRLREQHRFLMVDEWQDTSIGQYHLVRLLAGTEEANLFVVGSHSQAIYEWRQANYDTLSRAFYEDFPLAKLVILEENYRSTEQIVRCGRALLDGRYLDVDLVARRGPGEPVQDVRVPTEYDEAAFVASEALHLHHHGEGIPWKEMAVLMRTNAQAAPIEQEFMRQGIPYHLAHGQRLLFRKEVRDLLAYMKIVTTHDDSVMDQVVNTPPRGLGPVALRTLKGGAPTLGWEHLFQALSMGEERKLRQTAVAGVKAFLELLEAIETEGKDRPPADLIDVILTKSGYRAWLHQEYDGDSRLASIRELQREASEFVDTGAFLEAVRARLDAEAERADDQGVFVSTIHSVKGLQFQAVWLIGMEEGLLPHHKAADGWSNEEGERRLAHVAITRARDHLYLVGAKTRERRGGRVDTRPSRYLVELPRGDVTRARP